MVGRNFWAVPMRRWLVYEEGLPDRTTPTPPRRGLGGRQRARRLQGRGLPPGCRGNVPTAAGTAICRDIKLVRTQGSQASTPLARRGPGEALESEDGERAQIAPKQMMCAGSASRRRQHGEQELQRRREILEEAERRIRQPLGRGGEQQQRDRGDRAAEDQQRVGARAVMAEPARALPARARGSSPARAAPAEPSRPTGPSSESTGATLRRKP